MPVVKLGDMNPTGADADVMGPIYYDIQRGLAEAKRNGDGAQEKRLNEFYKQELDRAKHRQIVESAMPQKAQPAQSGIQDMISSLLAHLTGNSK
jgi:hypothetical protein